MNSVLHYFVRSYVPRHVSYFASNFAHLDKVVRMNAYPTAAVNEIFTQIQASCEKENLPVNIIHHCLNNSIQGVILPGASAGVFAFDIYDPLEMNYLASFSHEALAPLHENLARASEIFTHARLIHDEEEKIYMANMDFESASRLADETAQNIFNCDISRETGGEVHRFFGASTAIGNVNYINELTAQLSKRYFIKGRPGTGKSTFLNRIASCAKQHGLDTEIYHCALDPDSVDMIIVRSLGLCLFDSTAPHEFFPTRQGDEIIDIYEKCVTTGTDEKYKSELENLKAEYKSIISSAAQYLKGAESCAEELNDILPPMNEQAIENAVKNILGLIF